MQFNVATLLSEPVGSTRRYAIDETARIEGEPHRLTGAVEMIRTDRGILVRARIDSEAETECARCLGRFTTERSLGFEDEYTQTVDLTTGTKINDDREPDALVIDRRHSLDLLEAARQYWVIAESMHPLCREDCAGICPHCGLNLNEDRCDCAAPTDPRWAALRELAGSLTDTERR